VLARGRREDRCPRRRRHVSPHRWATSALSALDLYPVIQPWSVCYDLGPNDEHIGLHYSFASVFHARQPIVPTEKGFWKSDGGPYAYPHPGFAWGWQRRILDRIGGLFELGGMGSGDHHMALGMVGDYTRSIPPGASPNYFLALKSWADRACREVNRKLGFAHGTIEHPFHGRKTDRGYHTRWEMFLDNGFDPTSDLKRNTAGVIEFAGNKPNLEREFDNYLRAREEDVNTLT